jgi:hypothetical protein
MAANRDRLSRYAPTARRAEIGARDDLVQRHTGRHDGRARALRSTPAAAPSRCSREVCSVWLN